MYMYMNKCSEYMMTLPAQKSNKRARDSKSQTQHHINSTREEKEREREGGRERERERERGRERRERERYGVRVDSEGVLWRLTFSFLSRKSNLRPVSFNYRNMYIVISINKYTI